MISYLENKINNVETMSDSRQKELLKFNQVANEMQNSIIRRKSEQYDFDFVKEEKLTATEKKSEKFTDVAKKSETEEIVKEKKMLPLNSGSLAVNKYKLKLQSLLGNKTLRPTSVAE